MEMSCSNTGCVAIHSGHVPCLGVLVLARNLRRTGVLLILRKQDAQHNAYADVYTRISVGRSYVPLRSK